MIAALETSGTSDPFRSSRGNIEMGVASLEVIDAKLGYACAGSCAAFVRQMYNAINNDKIDTSVLNELTTTLSSAQGRINQDHIGAYEAILENGASALKALEGGDKKMAAFLLDCMSSTANGLYTGLRMNKYITPNFSFPQDHLENFSLDPPMDFTVRMRQIGSIFGNAVKRCQEVIDRYLRGE